MLTEEQKNCPYCHEQADHYAEPITGGFNGIGCGLIHVGGDWYMSNWNLDVMKLSDVPVIACSMCGRPLGGNEDE